MLRRETINAVGNPLHETLGEVMFYYLRRNAGSPGIGRREEIRMFEAEFFKFHVILIIG